ncbi:hypothetical protein IW140_002212 [Coemansia sp. RSA 1813]|nr:hypothetical protein EV178_001720 [Coemansia sp. RSA 1646]KAJ1770544.1 hypothetical protein LPJ74_003071 [Coemansia sp. RSA 1843]KAJ2092965.1 hypothetical protein IW138_000679 [Coemansia sp. RSA 986]KAJ2216286.1 hypothetical protein EV179_001525 [Coemansia sp. RSA 487]KAJ2570541.1 hypothetical protein IW140_002212 [Coemansia sp. RSA 1813]
MSTQEYIEKYRAQIQDKVAIVTGAASGLGKRLSEQLVNLGAKVLLVDISEDVRAVSAQINSNHGDNTTEWMLCDLANIQTIQTYFDKAITVFGHVDIVVNNAGIANSRSLFRQQDYSELDKILAVNLRAPMEATRIAVRYFKNTGRPGVVLNTASVGGMIPISMMESYGTTKAALIFFTTTCKNLAPLVRVNAVAPYFTDTPLVQNNRLVNSFPLVKQLGLMKPDKVVRAMLKAICDESLAGDTLMVSMGTGTRKVDFYKEQAGHVTSFIVGGTINRYSALVGTFFLTVFDAVIGFLRSPPPHSECTNR